MVRYANEYTLWGFFLLTRFVGGLTERYPEVFEGGGNSSQHQSNFAKKWKNYTTIMELANNDITKVDIVTNEPLEKCLLYLSYKSDKNELEALLHREAMKKIH